LTHEEFRRINGTLPSTRSTIPIDEATHMLVNMRLDPRTASAIEPSQHHTHQSMRSLPPKKFLSVVHSEAPRVRPRGPRPKPPKRGSRVLAAGTTAASGSSYNHDTRFHPFNSSNSGIEVRALPLIPSESHMEIDAIRPPPPRYPGNRLPTDGYIRALQDLQTVNRSLESWLPDRH